MGRRWMVTGAALALLVGAVAAVTLAMPTTGTAAAAGVRGLAKDDPVVLEVDHNGTLIKTYTQSQLEAMVYAGWAGFKNSVDTVYGPDPVQGVKISDVLSDALGATGFTAQQSLDIYAPDPYVQTMTYDQIENASPSNFDMYDATTKQQVSSLPGVLSSVLVWELGDPLATLPAGDGPLRFYVADAQNDNAVMVGSMSVKHVTKLNVRDQVLEPWDLKLVGLKIHGSKPTVTLDQNTYQACAAQGCHGSSCRAAGRQFTGVPLYLLMGEVDGGRDMTYNAALARKGYRIRLYSKNGHTVTISSKVTVRRASVIVANGVDGAALGALNYPLRLVAPTRYVVAHSFLGRIYKIVMLPRL